MGRPGGALGLGWYLFQKSGDTGGGGGGVFRGFNCQLWQDEACMRTHVHTRSGLHLPHLLPVFPLMGSRQVLHLLEVKPVGQIGQIEKQRRAGKA